jgi:hypothetical protein
MATYALMHYKGRYQYVHQRMAQRMEDSIHHPGSARKNNKKRGKARGNPASGNPSAQETKNEPRQADIDRRRTKEDRNPEGEEGEYTVDQGIAETD